MESFINYLKEKIEGCEMTKAPYRDKLIYQLVLDEYKGQLLLHDDVGQSEQLADDTVTDATSTHMLTEYGVT